MTAQFLHLGKAISFHSRAGPIPRLPSFAQKWRSWWCTRRGPQTWRWPFFRSKQLGLKQSSYGNHGDLCWKFGVFFKEIMKSTSSSSLKWVIYALDIHMGMLSKKCGGDYIHKPEAFIKHERVQCLLDIYTCRYTGRPCCDVFSMFSILRIKIYLDLLDPIKR